MFGKSKVNSSSAIIKDINESIKTLSYLARAEKYFDLELKKNGQVTKPLLRIVDIIEPLRAIADAVSKIGKGQKLDETQSKEILAAATIRQIIDVANDILALNPKGLVSSDKTALSKLSERLNEASKLAGVPVAKAASEETLLPKAKKVEAPAVKVEAPKPAAAAAPVAKQEKANDNNIQPKAEEVRAKTFGTAAPKTETPKPAAPVAAAKPAPAPVAAAKPAPAPAAIAPVEAEEDTTYISPIASGPSSAGDFPQVDYSSPRAWNSSPNASQNFRKLGEDSGPQSQAPAQTQQPQPAPQAQVTPAPQPQSQPYQQVVQSSIQPDEQFAADEPAQSQSQSQKVVPLKQNRKEFNLPQKYFATSYAGMNLQEAAEIISELANDPANLEIIMLEHASRVRPIAEGKEIIGDLLAIAPIADSFETGTEILDKKHLSVLKDAERIISICKDIANVKVEGFDRRKQKLFEKFIPEDIKKTVEWAKVAYPEVFANGDAQGETVSDILLDLSDLILSHSEEIGDKLFAELLSQVVSQIVLYAEHNDLRLKFDIVTKKNRLNSTPQPLNSRSEVAVLRAITFVPKIARQGHEILLSDNLSSRERDTVTKALDILQLSYVHARDNYSAEINSFYDNKAA